MTTRCKRLLSKSSSSVHGCAAPSTWAHGRRQCAAFRDGGRSCNARSAGRQPHKDFSGFLLKPSESRVKRRMNVRMVKIVALEVASAPSHDDFRVNRPQFDARVIDAELPINAALAIVDCTVPGSGFFS